MSNLYFSLLYKQTKFKVSVLLDFLQGLMGYYAVAKGRSPGIYESWDKCKEQVHRFSNPIYKKFNTLREAEEFIKQHTGSSTSTSNSKTLVPKKNLVCSGLVTIGSSKRQMSSSSDSDDELTKVNEKKKKKKSNESSTSWIKNLFSVDKDGYTEVYTDGACTSNGRGNAKAGVGIWFSDHNPYNVSQPVNGRATNNMAEIQAVTIAAQQAQKAGIKKLKINTDSQFLISCITQWMPKWKRNKWQTSTGKPVINKEELIEMEKALKPLKVSWNHVRGHVGIYGNEMADKLARDGSEHYTQK